MPDRKSLAGRAARAAAALLLLCALSPAPAAPPTPAELAMLYQARVDRRLQPPPPEVRRYAVLAETALRQAGIVLDRAQYVVLVDRSPRVQALLLLWRSAEGQWTLVGASPVSTGRPGSFDHFETPVGVFDHSLVNPDFRAEGTFNENNIRGYGVEGMRVFDFGWQRVPKGWGDHAVIDMRLQMHATDPDTLEPRLGTAQSKGCLRIPATLDVLLDHFGVLDADYDRLLREGHHLWMLPEDREPVADAGRYLVIVDTERTARPAWSPLPRLRR
ncbi:MAG: L,D-transpeptidase [Burkholderiales bacterium]|nr:L,D-transpeptidase [Burkholderiales bacterium]